MGSTERKSPQGSSQGPALWDSRLNLRQGGEGDPQSRQAEVGQARLPLGRCYSTGIGSDQAGALDSTTPLAAAVIEARGAEGDDGTPKPFAQPSTASEEISPALAAV